MVPVKALHPTIGPVLIVNFMYRDGFIFAICIDFHGNLVEINIKSLKQAEVA